MPDKRVNLQVAMLIDHLAVEQRALALLENDVKALETPERHLELGTTEYQNVAPELTFALTKLKKSTTFLFHILCFLGKQWDPDKELPTLSRNDLTKSIKDADDTIQKLIDTYENAKSIEASKKGVIHTLENGVKSLCVHVKPFLKTFLAVAVTGSSVIMTISLMS
jgi:hypothetical protein